MSTKEEHTGASYELIYWPNIPGRGEFVRLALEATGTPYKDICNQQEDGIQELIGLTSPTNSSGYPLFAPPILRVTGTGKYHVGENGDDPLIIHQTPNILIYLAGKIGLEGGDRDANQVIARQIMLTAFDLNNEAHDTHHPVTVMEVGFS